MPINTYKKNEEPQERPDTRMVQSCLNSDGTRTLVKYDEKRKLSEFARYITKKITNKYGILYQ
jgi:hypothetical protein